MKIFRQKRKNLPGFWSRYLNSIKEELPKDVSDIRFVVFDTETTGFDIVRDRILSIGALVLINNTIKVSETLELYLKQDDYNSNSAAVHGIIRNEKRPCCTETEALIKFLDFIGNSVLVAHHANFDIGMINKALKRQQLPGLKNKVIDTGVLYKKTLINSPLLERRDSYSLDHLAYKFNIGKKDRHTALGDAYITAMAFLYILNRLENTKKPMLKDLM